MISVEWRKKIAYLCIAFPALFLINSAKAADTTNSNYEVTVDAALTLTIPTNVVHLTVNPSSHPFDYGDLDVVITTNHLTGYTLSMSADGTSLIQEIDDSQTIPTLTDLAGGYTEDTFTANRWGYHVGTTGNYLAFTSGAKIAESSGPASNDTITVRFGAKVDGTQEAGVYSNVLEFTATANL